MVGKRVALRVGGGIGIRAEERRSDRHERAGKSGRLWVWRRGEKDTSKRLLCKCIVLTIGSLQAPGASSPSSTCSLKTDPHTRQYDRTTNTNRSVVIPSIILAGVNAYRLWTEHWEHVAHGPALEDKPEYPFQNIRTKNYFWGDGDKVRSFGLNEAVNSPCQSEVLTPHADPLLEPQGQLPQEGVKKDAFLKHEKDAPVIFGSRKADHASPANETAAVCRKPIYLLCRNMQTPPVQKDC